MDVPLGYFLWLIWFLLKQLPNQGYKLSALMRTSDQINIC